MGPAETCGEAAGGDRRGDACGRPARRCGDGGRPAPAGPATAALYENKAKRAAILRDTSAKLKAVGKAPATEAALAPAKPAAKTRASTKTAAAAPKPKRASVKASPAPTVEAAKVSKPRAARKPKAAAE